MASLIINTSELVDMYGQWLASRDGHPGTIHPSQIAAFIWLKALAEAAEVPPVPEEDPPPPPVTYDFPAVGFAKGR